MEFEYSTHQRQFGREDPPALAVRHFHLQEMLTGRQPLPAAPAAPSTLNPHAPREMDAIVLKAFSKAADGRYESAATLAAEPPIGLAARPN